MTIAEIKALPDEFDFKTTRNPGFIYHAVKEKYGYIVTVDDRKWEVDEKYIYKNLINGNFVISIDRSVDKNKFIDQLNGILKDHFDYVPLDTTLKIAEELINILPTEVWK